ncbi:hypothetical protein Gasu2_51230 [Galdieria sulphuraria]|uniref:Transmembrane protein 14 n=1 Tax=Galdieria sulphuraria TaxID=130081 RepID=M2XLC6_GALSU|nr:uncharacterized protein Gasu_17320 [Galdieria sulphuraria]EME30967.1 hypothetical protein Gasu_17320 [Galdieria sulphuraria]GJD10963.1 hypothetical protein Gasu2_51230 [Galdieria sulphuraria]|eukprot:XP_005707487.1 hypothetical protein Gasu_17320 [Galdieria sulphuraria]
MAFIQSQSANLACRHCSSGALGAVKLCRRRYTSYFGTDRTSLNTRVNPLGSPLCRASPFRKHNIVCSLTRFAETLMLFYAFLLAGGGVAGYLKVKSTASIVSGVVSGLLLTYAWYEKSIPVALVVSLVLVVVSAIRFSKSKKFMPAGLLGVVSVCASVIFAMALRA